MGFFLGCFGSATRRKLTYPTKTEDRICPERQSIDEKGSPVAGVKRYSWEEIESFTMNFKEVIGVGGYSTVYLAKFPDSTLGAVKIYNSSERLNQVFKSELEISQKLHHANIVKLLGYCDERDEGVLVLEYIPKGDLQEELHNQTSKKTNNVSKKPTLSWTQRVSIAYQLSKALEYLHDNHDLQIVHGDIKSSNVLLDEQFTVKLCDFGLAKMGFSSMVKPASSSRLAMMGSPGYIDPHFLMTGIASKKSDIYSFGVILLELITGLEAYMSVEDRNVLLTSIVRTKENFDAEKVVKMVDPRVRKSADAQEVKAIASIAGKCLHHLPSMRPTSSEICKMMHEEIPSVSLVMPAEK